MNLAFTFKVNGGTLSGTVDTMMGELSMTPGKVIDTTFSFDVNAGGMLFNHFF